MLLFFPDLSVVEDETTAVGEERKGEISDEKQALEEEIALVDVSDTSSFLETLDNEVSMMVSA